MHVEVRAGREGGCADDVADGVGGGGGSGQSGGGKVGKKCAESGLDRRRGVGHLFDCHSSFLAAPETTLGLTRAVHPLRPRQRELPGNIFPRGRNRATVKLAHGPRRLRDTGIVS